MYDTEEPDEDDFQTDVSEAWIEYLHLNTRSDIAVEVAEYGVRELYDGDPTFEKY